MCGRLHPCTVRNDRRLRKVPGENSGTNVGFGDVLRGFLFLSRFSIYFNANERTCNPSTSNIHSKPIWHRTPTPFLFVFETAVTGVCFCCLGGSISAIANRIKSNPIGPNLIQSNLLNQTHSKTNTSHNEDTALCHSCIGPCHQSLCAGILLRYVFRRPPFNHPRCMHACMHAFSQEPF